MSAPRPRRILLVALAAAAATAVWQAWPVLERAVLPAVEAEAFTALTGRTAASTPELWERLKAMGIAAVVLREETAADLAARGALLHFSRAEVEKWRALGLVAAGGGPKPDSLWTKDARVLARLHPSATGPGGGAYGAVAGGWALELASGVDLARVPAGFDPETLAVVSSAGLIPVMASTGPSMSVAGRRFWVRSLSVAARPPELLRAVNGRALRLLILKPSAGVGLDDNLERLRAALKVVKSAGLPAVLSSSAPGAPAARLEKVVRLFLLYAIGLLGPLLAVRAGLGAERTVRRWVAAHAETAAPVPETLAGLAAAWATASAAGLLAAMSVAPGAREALARSWTVWTLSAPLVAGAAALFASEGRALRARWRAPLRLSDLAAAFVLALALFGLLAPRAALRATGIWELVDSLPSVADVLWWWPWRWREILIGTPSLVLALILIGKRETAARDGGSDNAPKFLGDPRGWLVLGLLGPAGTVAAIGAGGAAPTLSVAHGAVAAAIGAALGFLLAGLRARIDIWVFRPTP